MIRYIQWIFNVNNHRMEEQKKRKERELICDSEYWWRKTILESILQTYVGRIGNGESGRVAARIVGRIEIEIGPSIA